LETALLTRADPAQAIRGDYQYVALHEGHPIQRFWHYNKQLTIARYLPPERGDLVIDVGCGSGVISNFLAQHGARTLGIDASHDAIAFASRTFTAENLSFRRGAFHEVFPLAEPVDKIYCLEMIEHIYTREAIEMLAVFRDSLKPGGRLYLTTPNGRSMWPLIEWLMDTLHLAPQMADYQHLARYSPASLPRAAQLESGAARQSRRDRIGARRHPRVHRPQADELMCVARSSSRARSCARCSSRNFCCEPSGRSRWCGTRRRSGSRSMAPAGSAGRT
jgi:2-polyprenyl-3-methyl-5-hydroxy-6-metoxy-1,4-benzoquinol methylase